jgi:hypothetical protein
MLFKETIGVYNEDHAKPRNTSTKCAVTGYQTPDIDGVKTVKKMLIK